MKPNPIVNVLLDTFLAPSATAFAVAIFISPFVTWIAYGFSFQFIAASIVFIFMLLVLALLSR